MIGELFLEPEQCLKNADSGFTINKDESFAGLPKENSQIIFLFDQQ